MKILEWFRRKSKNENHEISEEEIQRVHSEVRKDLSNFEAEQRRDNFKLIQKSKPHKIAEQPTGGGVVEERDQIKYCLSKQLFCMEYIHTNYGDIELDDEMQAIIETALRELLEKRLSELE